MQQKLDVFAVVFPVRFQFEYQQTFNVRYVYSQSPTCENRFHIHVFLEAPYFRAVVQPCLVSDFHQESFAEEHIMFAANERRFRCQTWHLAVLFLSCEQTRRNFGFRFQCPSRRFNIVSPAQPVHHRGCGRYLIWWQIAYWQIVGDHPFAPFVCGVVPKLDENA